MKERKCPFTKNGKCLDLCMFNLNREAWSKETKVSVSPRTFAGRLDDGFREVGTIEKQAIKETPCALLIAVDRIIKG